MSRHRKIDVRMWGDAKFNALSSPPPCGQFLWLYLMSGPHTTSLPGLFVVGEAALAEALGWPMKGFREAFDQACRQGMAKADWKARLVWLPNAIKYNEPENPNVVLSWRHFWDEIPECPLKAEAYLKFRDYFTKKPTFRAAFLKAFGKGFDKGDINSASVAQRNQEQEQEQEQDISVTNVTLAPGDETPPTPSQFLAAWNAVPTFKKARSIKDDRLRTFRARARDPEWVADWREALARAARIPGCNGTVEWQANVDWFLRPNTVLRLVEGAYDGWGVSRNGHGGHGGGVGRAGRLEAPPGKYDHLDRPGANGTVAAAAAAPPAAPPPADEAPGGGPGPGEFPF